MSLSQHKTYLQLNYLHSNVFTMHLHNKQLSSHPNKTAHFLSSSIDCMPHSDYYMVGTGVDLWSSGLKEDIVVS